MVKIDFFGPIFFLNAENSLNFHVVYVAFRVVLRNPIKTSHFEIWPFGQNVVPWILHNPRRYIDKSIKIVNGDILINFPDTNRRYAARLRRAEVSAPMRQQIKCLEHQNSYFVGNVKKNYQNIF